MSRLIECLVFVLEHEGGYSNNRADRGGATNRGITQATYDDWRTRNGMPRNPVVGISGAEVEAIYRTRYWLPVCADSLVPPLDLVLFDAAVQHGPGRAAKWLQRVVGARQDGAIGPQTLTATALLVERDGVDSVVEHFMQIREDFYQEIVANDPKQAVFERGWANRMIALQEAVRDCV